jgi:Holliday junction resolvase RusA-like endonuclease
MTCDAFVASDMGSPESRAPLLAAFAVEGIPEPKGSLTAIVRGGRAVLVPGLNRKRKDGTRSDGRQRYERWCRSVTAAAVAYQAVNRRVVRDEEALIVELAFFLPKPPSTPRRVTRPNRKPDIDKLTRAVFDCLTKSGSIADDARIVRMIVDKRFAIDRTPRVEIFIRDAAGVSQGALL